MDTEAIPGDNSGQSCMLYELIMDGNKFASYVGDVPHSAGPS